MNTFKLAREYRGLSIIDLAKKLKIDTSLLQKIEFGIVDIEKYISTIAKALNFKEDFFRQKIDIYPLYPFDKEYKQLSAKKRTMYGAFANIVGLNVASLYSRLIFENKTEIPYLDIHEYGSAKLIANLVRRLWRVPNGAIKKITSLVERSGIIVMLSDFNSHIITSYNPPIIFVKDIEELRFNIAKQLGYIVMSKDISIDAESEAEEFAYEFLMPSAEVDHRLVNIDLYKLAELKKQWGLTMSRILKRVKQNGHIVGNNNIEKMFKSQSFELEHSVNLKIEKPTAIKEMIKVYNKDLKFNMTNKEIADMLLLSHEDFEWLYGNANYLRIVS